VTKVCTTLAGTGDTGLIDGPFEHAQFSEPGGLCVGPEGTTLFIADTNNHAIRILDLDTREVTQVSIAFQFYSSLSGPIPLLPLTLYYMTVICSYSYTGVSFPRHLATSKWG